MKIECWKPQYRKEYKRRVYGSKQGWHDMNKKEYWFKELYRKRTKENYLRLVNNYRTNLKKKVKGTELKSKVNLERKKKRNGTVIRKETHYINKTTDLHKATAIKWYHFGWNQFQAPKNESLSGSCFWDNMSFYKFCIFFT